MDWTTVVEGDKWVAVGMAKGGGLAEVRERRCCSSPVVVGERERGKVGEADGGLTEVGPTVRWQLDGGRARWWMNFAERAVEHWNARERAVEVCSEPRLVVAFYKGQEGATMARLVTVDDDR
jgi:hypothetical protein